MFWRFQNSSYLCIRKREICIIDAKDGPFVYRLGRKIFILERGVRFPQGLQIKNNKRTKLKISRDGKSQIITKENQTGREEKTS